MIARDPSRAYGRHLAGIGAVDATGAELRFGDTVRRADGILIQVWGASQSRYPRVKWLRGRVVGGSADLSAGLSRNCTIVALEIPHRKSA